MSTPKFKVGDRVKWIADDGRELSGVVAVAATTSGQVSVRENADDRFVSWWHESHLLRDVPLASKFKVGDRVKWLDVEGRRRKGVITSAQLSSHAEPVSFYIKEAQELKPGHWHESHLSLDVPELKKYATDLESQLGAEIIALHYAATDREKELTEAREQIERRRRIEKNQAIACEHLSNRLVEEIGGHARVTKELADLRKDLADLRTISKRLAL